MYLQPQDGAIPHHLLLRVFTHASIAYIVTIVTQIVMTVHKVIVINIFPFRFIEVASLDYIYIISQNCNFVNRINVNKL